MARENKSYLGLEVSLSTHFVILLHVAEEVGIH